jgi:hypothetical protein
MPTIDVHSHVIPPAVAEAVAADPTGFSARIEEGGSGEKRVVHDQGYALVSRAILLVGAVRPCMDAPVVETEPRRVNRPRFSDPLLLPAFYLKIIY